MTNLHNDLWTFALTIAWGDEAAVPLPGFACANKRWTAAVNEKQLLIDSAVSLEVPSGIASPERWKKHKSRITLPTLPLCSPEGSWERNAMDGACPVTTRGNK